LYRQDLKDHAALVALAVLFALATRVEKSDAKQETDLRKCEIVKWFLRYEKKDGRVDFDKMEARLRSEGPKQTLAILKNCDAFWQCVREREQEKEKTKHCYESTWSSRDQ
jgi:hypothetical protein